VLIIGIGRMGFAGEKSQACRGEHLGLRQGYSENRRRSQAVQIFGNSSCLRNLMKTKPLILKARNQKRANSARGGIVENTESIG